MNDINSLDFSSFGVAFFFIVLLLTAISLSQVVMDGITYLHQRIYVKRCEYRWDMLYRSGDNVIEPCHWNGCPFRRDCPFYEKRTFIQSLKALFRKGGRNEV